MISRRLATLAVAVLAFGLPASMRAQTINFCDLRSPAVTNWLDVAPAQRVIAFQCCEYVPRCSKIDAGQSVTFSGDFGAHPLVPGLVKGGGMQMGNPIPSVSSGNDPVEVTFPEAGAWGFYCDFHEPAMSGAVLVALFADGFESADTAEWSSTVPIGFPLDD